LATYNFKIFSLLLQTWVSHIGQYRNDSRKQVANILQVNGFALDKFTFVQVCVKMDGCEKVLKQQDLSPQKNVEYL